MVRLICLLTCVGLAGGCRSAPVRTPTPAATLTAQEIEATIPAPPGERYYLLVFGSQSIPKVPRYTHTWVTAVRVPAGDVAGTQSGIEAHTISWMPATLSIRPWRFRVEPGVNLDLHTSMREMLSHDERVSLWGPFEIRPGLYQKVVMQKRFLESGTIGYQCIDTIGEAARLGNGSDCYHAVTDADTLFDRRHYPLSRFGEAASENVAREVIDRGGVVGPCVKHDWLLPVLGLARYPITRR
jgi:hypothetical protein